MFKFTYLKKYQQNRKKSTIYVGNLVKIMHSEIEGNRLKTVGGDSF